MTSEGTSGRPAACQRRSPSPWSLTFNASNSTPRSRRNSLAAAQLAQPGCQKRATATTRAMIASRARGTSPDRAVRLARHAAANSGRMQEVITKLPSPAARWIDELGRDAWLDRDLSWLEFNRRVLHEALDDRTPLLERVKFLAIFTANLDEFFMKRMAIIRPSASDTSLAAQERRERLTKTREVISSMLSEQ